MGTSNGVARSWTERHAALHGLLRAQREALREQRRSLREATPPETIVVADEEERAAQELELGLDIALIEMRSRQVQEIEDALSRIETGGYGRCVDCGEPILASRLSARPYAVRCRACQEALEAEDRGLQPTPAVEPSLSPWALLGAIPGPGSGGDATAPKGRRVYRGTAVPVNRPAAYGGVGF